MFKTIKLIALGLMLITGGILFSQEISALEIVRILDSYTPETITSTIKMVTENNGRITTNVIKQWKDGNTKTLFEFSGLSQNGDKFIQLGNKAWLYSADMEEVIPMSRYMLRESAFGTDLSFEELAEGVTIESKYTSSLLPEDPEFPNTYVLELKAKKKTESVQKMIYYVDKTDLYLIRSFDYAPSGALLKDFTSLETIDIDGYRIHTKVIVRNSFKKDSKTTYTFSDIVM